MNKCSECKNNNSGVCKLNLNEGMDSVYACIAFNPILKGEIILIKETEHSFKTDEGETVSLGEVLLRDYDIDSLLEGGIITKEQVAYNATDEEKWAVLEREYELKPRQFPSIGKIAEYLNIKEWAFTDLKNKFETFQEGFEKIVDLYWEEWKEKFPNVKMTMKGEK